MVISERTLIEAGQALGDALRALISTDGNLPRPTQLSRGWKLDQTLCTRVCGALRNEDPLTLLYQMPGPPSVKMLTAAGADRPEVAPAVLQEALAQLAAYESLIQEVGGKKTNLDTLVGSRVLEAREKTEQRSKQSIFRGMTNLYGLQSEVAMTSFFTYPSSDPGLLNELAIYGSCGLKRLRPELPILVGGRILMNPPPDIEGSAKEILHGGDLGDDGYSIALKDFSSDPFPHVEVERDGQRLLYILPGDDERRYEELTMYFASIERHASRLTADAKTDHALFGFVPRNPSRQMLVDIFIHDGVWDGVEPEVEILRNDAALASRVAPRDVFDFCESVEFLGSDPAKRKFKGMPRYEELLDSVLAKQGLDPASFRLYRFNVKYPVIGLRYQARFPLPA